MTMSRQSIRNQMQALNPKRKRQLYEVAPSPPKKWIKFVSTDSPVSSPANSPAKGPLVDNSDDDSAPSFRSKSFYGRKRKVHVPVPSHNVEGDSSAALTVTGNTSSESSQNSPTIKESARFSVKSTTRRRVALSPIKNVVDSIRKERKTRSSTRHRSLPSKTSTNVTPKLDRIVKDQSDSSSSTTPVNKHKFFKHKTPASASKAVGGIIIEKGFNLRFVRGCLSRDFGISPAKKTGPAAKFRSTPKVVKTYSRSTSKTDSSISLTRSDVSASSRSSTWQNSSLQQSLDTELTPSSSFSEGKIFDEDSESLSIPSALSPDTQSLASDVSGPVNIRKWTRRDHIPQSAMPSEEDSSIGFGTDNTGKFYSIFARTRHSQRLAVTETSPENKEDSQKESPQRKFFAAKGDDKQLMLDAGQEKFGATQCMVCGMVYSPGDTADETTHNKFHQSAVTALRFPGWKKEHVIKEFLDDGSRVIVVRPEDQRFMVKKVEEVNKVMGQELGFPDHVFSFHGSYKAFLYISDEKRVEGCCIAESITQGYRILPNNKELSDTQRPWFCSTVPETASVGIGRLWVYGPSRQQGIASRLLDCIRQWFEYGIMIEKSQLAFSDPTPDGRKFAAKYTRIPNFLVYKYNN